MKPKKIFSTVLIVFLGLIPSVFAKEAIVSIHSHSSVSKGKQSLEQLARSAQSQNIDVLLLSDDLVEHYEYGWGIFRNLWAAKVERESIVKYGIKKYLEDIKLINSKYPNTLLIAAPSVTPFYYWSGNPWPGPLLLNDRAKDMLVLGIEDAKPLEDLPIVGLKKSSFSTYDGPQHAAPYQAFIDHVKNRGGLVFLAHPGAEEKVEMKLFNKIRVMSHTEPSTQDLLALNNYTGFGISAVELLEASSTRQYSALSGGVWDQVLLQYIEGKRDQPVWVYGEADYGGDLRSADQLASIINVTELSGNRESQVIEQFKRGAFYVVVPSFHDKGRLILEEFAIHGTAEVRDRVVELGTQVQAHEAPQIVVAMRNSGRAGKTIHLQLVRNGELLKKWDETLPFQREIFDSNTKSPAYYRLFAYTDEGDRLLTNPIFLDVR